MSSSFRLWSNLFLILLFWISSIQFNSIFLFRLYKIFTLYIVRQEYTNKGSEEEGKKKRKLMAWVEVYGGQRSLAFELTTESLA